MENPPRLQLIGGGQLGRSLGRLFAERCLLRVDAVVCRSPASAEAAVAFIGAGRALTQAPAPQAGDIWLLAVPDDALARLALDLALASGESQAAAFAGVTVLHCSGALAADVLRPLRAAGAVLASVHPLRSFADPARAVAEFEGTWCGVEGDAPALQRLLPLFSGLGARCVRLRSEGKTEYHAAAVVASNYLVSLIEVALRLFEQAGIERETGLQMLAPLSSGTLGNLLAQGPAAALSGPVLRGDAGTVQRQLAAMQALGMDELYRQLGRIALDLARERGQASAQSLDAIGRLLDAAVGEAPHAPESKR